MSSTDMMLPIIDEEFTEYQIVDLLSYNNKLTSITFKNDICKINFNNYIIENYYTSDIMNQKSEEKTEEKTEEKSEEKSEEKQQDTSYDDELFLLI